MRHLTATTPQELAEAIAKFPNATSWLVHDGGNGYAQILLFDKHGDMIADIANYS